MLLTQRHSLFFTARISGVGIQRTHSSRRRVFTPLGSRPRHKETQHIHNMEGDGAQAAGRSSAEAAVLVPHTTEVLVVKASAQSSVATMINVAVGAGVLSLPFAFSCTGWVLGLALTAGVAAVEVATLCVLCHYAEETGARSYSALVNRKLGLGAGIALSCIMAFYLLLTCTAYVMIAADCLCPLLAGAFGPGAWWAGRPAVVAAVGLGVALPLSLPRRLGAIAAVSTFKVYAIVSVVGAVVLRSVGTIAAPDYSWEHVHAFHLSQSLLAALPILAFGFQCHTAVISVWDELEDTPSLLHLHPSRSLLQPSGAGSAAGAGTGGRSFKQQGMIGVAAASIGAVACFYSIMGCFGYVAFPEHVASNIMNSFPQSDPVMQVARAMVGLIVIAAYPVNSLPARATLLDLLGHTLGAGGGAAEGTAGARDREEGQGEGDGPVAREEVAAGGLGTLVTVAFCLVSTGIALEVSDLGSMFQLIGGTAASVLIFGIPGALLIQASLEQAQRAMPKDQDAPPAPGSAGASASASGAEGLQRPLLPGRRRGVRWWGSRAFWAGAGLEVATVGLWGITIYNLVVLQQ